MSEAFNEPAFPNIGNSTWNLTPSEGMTLRDYFAGQALAGGLALVRTGQLPASVSASEVIAKAAYEIADAMLQERAK